MNCRTFKHRIIELLDTRPDPAQTAKLMKHAEACPECARELEENRAVLELLHPSRTIKATPQFKERVMEKIQQIQEQPETHSKLWRRVGILAAAAAIWFVGIGLYNMYAVRNGKPAQSGFEVLARAAEVMRSITTMHIKAQMCTPPRDNFEYIHADLPMIDVDLWKQYGNPPQWRIEKSGRYVTNDGKKSLLVVPSENGDQPWAVQGGPRSGFIEWLRPMLSPDKLLDTELALARQEGSKIEQTETTMADGKKCIVLKIEAKAQGDFSQSDYLKNKAIVESDHIRTYTFDAETRRLLGVQVLIKTGKEPVLVFATKKIEYDTPLDTAMFSTKMPENAFVDKSPYELPNMPDTSNMTPKQAAEAFFKACAEENWDEARVYLGSDADRPRIREFMGGLQVISIGEPFKSGLYGGWFVPYEIKLKSGHTKKFNLAIRNDNPKKMWCVDGGF